MSFVKYRDKIFSKNRYESAQKRIVGQLKNVASCTDCRAWSTNREIQRQYILDSFSFSLENKEYVLNKLTSECLKIFKQRPKYRRRKYGGQKRKTTYNEKLFATHSSDTSSSEDLTDVSPEKIKENYDKESIQSELDNLRNLVKDLKEQILYLEDYKKENKILRAELGNDLRKQLTDAEAEIILLTKKLDIYCGIENRYEVLQMESNTLREQYTELLKNFHQLKQDKEHILEELNVKKDELEEKNSRALVVSNAAVDKEILRDRIKVKDDKISFLLNIVENQEYTIHDLTLEIQNLKAGYSYKEEKLIQNLTQLRLAMHQQTTKTTSLENQLQSTEELVKELENLRDQFRITNCAMAENIHTYKRQFNTIRSTTEHMMTVIEDLKVQISEKDKEIKKLSIYPQNALSVVYFSHLDYVLNSTVTMEGNSEQINSALVNMKDILKRIKQEIWKSDNTPDCFQIINRANQTELSITDNYTQFESLICEQCVQTNTPDEYIIKYNDAQMIIKKLYPLITDLKITINTKEKEITSLEGKLISCIEEKAVKICQAEQLKEKLIIVQHQLDQKNKDLKFSDILLTKSAEELNFEKNCSEYTNSLFINALDSTFSEYNSYISVLETFIDYNEKNINIIYSFIINEVNRDTNNISQITDEMNNLYKALDNDKLISQELLTKINFLKEAMNTRNQYVDLIEKKLSIAESTIEELQSFSTEGGYIASEDSTIIKSRNNRENNVIDKKMCYGKGLQKVLKYYKREKQELKKKITQMQINVRRVNKFVRDLQKRLNISEKLITYLNLMGDELTCENNSLKEERLSLIKDVEEYNNKLLNMKINLEDFQMKNNEYQDEKQKMEEALVKVLKKLDKYKNELSKNKRQVQKINNKCLQQEEHLEVEINALKERNGENLMVIENLKQQLLQLKEIEEMETEMKREISRSVQVNIRDTDKDVACKSEMNKMKEHYDCVIKTLEKEYNINQEKAQQQHLNNLKSMKNTYERDIKSIKKTHKENIAKIQILHEEELAILKLLKEQPVYHDKATEVDFHREEMEKLKQNYFSLLNEKEKSFLEKIEAMKIDEYERFAKEKEIEINKVKECNQIKRKKLRRKFQKHQRKVRESYQRKITALQTKYKVLFDEEILKLVNSKAEMVDSEVQCEEVEVLTEDECPVKESAQKKVADSPLTYKKGDSINLRKVLLREMPIEDLINELNVTLPLIDDELKISKKFMNEISDKEVLSVGMDFFPIQDNHELISDLKPMKLKERELLLNRITMLENELSLRNHDLKRNAAIYDKKIKEEQMKNKEMASLLHQEMNHSHDVQCRLGLEYNRAEQLQIEKEELKNKCSILKYRVEEIGDKLENEKNRASILMNEIEKLSTQGDYADQLELSLLRLRHKLDQALECEKRLTLELRKEMQHKKKIEAMLRINEITEEHSDKSKSSKTKSDSELKVIFIQQCGILHTWSKQITY